MRQFGFGLGLPELFREVTTGAVDMAAALIRLQGLERGGQPQEVVRRWPRSEYIARRGVTHGGCRHPLKTGVSYRSLLFAILLIVLLR